MISTFEYDMQIRLTGYQEVAIFFSHLLKDRTDILCQMLIGDRRDLFRSCAATCYTRKSVLMQNKKLAQIVTLFRIGSASLELGMIFSLDCGVDCGC
jgi:hypothetical protein